MKQKFGTFNKEIMKIAEENSYGVKEFDLSRLQEPCNGYDPLAVITSKKNNTIFLGEFGVGKSYAALDIAMKHKGPVIIINGLVGKEYYEDAFPMLKEFEQIYDPYRIYAPYQIKENGKYYLNLHTEENASFPKSIQIIAIGITKLIMEGTENMLFLFDDAAWEILRNDISSIWAYPSSKSSVLITAVKLQDILQEKEYYSCCEEIPENIEDIWNIVNI